MVAIVRSVRPRRAASPRLAALGGLSALLLLVTGLVAASAEAAPASVAPAVRTAATAAPAATPVDVRTLAITGTTTSVVVHRIYRSGQAAWVSHLLDTRLVDLDGCQAVRTPATRRNATYRATVRTVCTSGPARAEQAARALVADRPWYQLRVTRVPLVGFTLLADLPAGNDRAVPAALAQLPSGGFTFADGDDVSLNYVGQGVTQAKLDAAVAAFAHALSVPASSIRVLPLAES